MFGSIRSSSLQREFATILLSSSVVIVNWNSAARLIPWSALESPLCFSKMLTRYSNWLGVRHSVSTLKSENLRSVESLKAPIFASEATNSITSRVEPCFALVTWWNLRDGLSCRFHNLSCLMHVSTELSLRRASFLSAEIFGPFASSAARASASILSASCFFLSSASRASLSARRFSYSFASYIAWYALALSCYILVIWLM